MAAGAARPERSPRAAAQVRAGVASLLEAWLRDTATCAVVLLSLGPAVTGVAAGGAVAAVGVCAGAGAAAAAVTPTIRRWRPGRAWLLLLAVAALDVVLVLVPVLVWGSR